jgi:hypothetical protein
MAYSNHTATSATTLTLLAVVVTVLATGCKTQEVPSGWLTEPIQVDGKMTEWSDIPTTYFEDQGIVLGIGNDDKNLFIHFRFKNDTWAQAIRMTGLTLWMDVNGKKNKKVGLQFYEGPSPKEPMAARGDEKFDDSSQEQRPEFPDRGKPPEKKFVFFDSSYYVEADIPFGGSKGPAAGYDTSKGFYSYEFSIPLKESGVQFYGLGVQPGQTISLGAEWGDMGMDRGGRGGGPPGGGGMGGGPPGGGGGMGGGPPGGMGGGRGGPGGGEKKLSEKQEIWVKTQLALPPAEQQE